MIRNLHSALMLSALLAWLGAPAAQSQVVFSEILYHPVEEAQFNPDGTPVLDLTEEVHAFIELHNPGPSPVVLDSWRITSAVEFVFPAGAEIQPGAYLVVAKDPKRLSAVTAYGLTEGEIYGPYVGQLGNDGETIRLKDTRGKTVEEVTYSPRFPWPIGADAFGAGPDWTGLKEKDYQYRGRSLERVSFTHSAQDPANWLASPLPGNPSPGRPNAFNRPVPLPVVVALNVVQHSTGQPTIYRDQPARVECAFSATNDLAGVRLQYFVDDLNVTNEVVATLDMAAIADQSEGTFRALVPGKLDRGVVRYRILAQRGATNEVVSPRVDDPFRWHAYFVTPVRKLTNETYDLFIARASLTRLAANLQDNPQTGYLPPTNAVPNARWNKTEPGIFVHNGVVYDVRTRYNGSYFRRSVDRQSYKVEFPAYRVFDGQNAILVTDKDWMTVAEHQLFREAAIPTALTRWVNLYVNTNGRLFRLQIEEHDQRLLERYHQEQARLHPDRPAEEAGRIFKSSGILEDRGPYGRGDGSQLRTNGFWKPLPRYEWVYASKNNDWQGYTPFKELLDKLAAARGTRATNVAALRAYFQAYWDVDRLLTYVALRNWASTWDDTVHNFHLWQQHNGKWGMLPWDFDADMGQIDASRPTISIYRGEDGNVDNTHGTHTIKDSFFKAFRQEYRERLFLLNNTLLHPDSPAMLGLTYLGIPTFARARHTNVNSQCKLGVFHRPDRPVNLAPRGGESIFFPARLESSAYVHSTNPAPTHLATEWRIRRSDGDYLSPVLAVTTTNDLTSWPIPFAALEYGRTYFWQCIHLDANNRPSLPSAETAFQFGGKAQRDRLVTLEGASAWKFNDSGANLGTAWRDPSFDDSAWPEGPPLLGLSSASLFAPIRTPLAAGRVTYYFRQRFSFPADPKGARLYLGHIVDDGAVFYLNGTELFRTNMVKSAVGASTLANKTVGNPAFDGPYEVPATNLFRGDNVLAAEVHQVLASSPDVVFGAVLEGTYSPPLSGVVLSEIMANNRAAVPNVSRYPDWIELYNAGDQPQSLEGLSLTDDMLVPRKFIFPPGASLAAHGYVVVWCDDAFNDPGWHTGFKLDAAGETMALFRANANRVELLDAVSFGLQLVDVSIGRAPGVMDAWTLNQPTPNAANQPQPLGASSQLKINEWLAASASGDDWLEVFNPAPLPVALGELALSDSLANPTNSPIPHLSFIAGGGFRAFIADGNTNAGGDHVNFSLAAHGGTIGLFDAQAKVIDYVVYGTQAPNISQGCQPDGWTRILSLTDGASPGSPNAPDSDGDGLPDFWESAHGLNPRLAGDPALDPDGDGPTNWEEFLSGTDPQSAGSNLRLETALVGEAQNPAVAIRFLAAARQTYTIQFKDSLSEPLWQKLADVGARATAGPVEVLDANAAARAGRYYRVVTPRRD